MIPQPKYAHYQEVYYVGGYYVIYKARVTGVKIRKPESLYVDFIYELNNGGGFHWYEFDLFATEKEAEKRVEKYFEEAKELKKDYE